MQTAVMDWVRVGLGAMAFILLAKLVFTTVKVPGLSGLVASV
jgi:hypothetical protein